MPRTENWAAKAQAAISAVKAHEAELAAQAGALARARETQDAAEQATIAAQLPLKEAVEALADRDAQLVVVVRRDLDLEHERHARAVHDSAAATAVPPVGAQQNVLMRITVTSGEVEDARGRDEEDADVCSDPEADDDQLEACRFDDSVLAEQLAAVSARSRRRSRA